jgi:putative ABC transport system permease protein
VTLATLVLRSLRFYWRTGVAVVLGGAVATAVLIGSLLVGDSVRGSIRDVALARLGGVDAAIFSPGFFRAALADDLAAKEPALAGRTLAPVLIAQGTVSNADSEETSPQVSIIGRDERFERIVGMGAGSREGEQGAGLTGNFGVLNTALARDLNIPATGGRVLVTLELQPGVVSDMLFSQRKKERTTRRAALDVVVSDARAADFSVSAQTTTPRNIFVPYAWLAQRIGKPGMADALLIGDAEGTPAALPAAVRTALCQPADYGLKLAPHPAQGYLSVESESFLLSPAQRQGVETAAKAVGVTPEFTSVYMASHLSVAGSAGRPALTASYAMVAGVGSTQHLCAGNLSLCTPALRDTDIILTDWLAQDTGAKVGDGLTVSYFVPAYDGVYREKSIHLTVAGIAPMAGRWVDAGLVPTIKGITDAQRIDAWETPFPVEKQLVTPRDEAYWKVNHAAPKAFVSLKTAQAMWQSAPAGANADWVTSVRLYPPAGMSLSTLQQQLADALQRAMTPEQAGLTIRPVRQIAVASAQGTTDFGELFLTFGFFLVASAAGLAAMMMRLMADRRAAQAGAMLAFGFARSKVRRAVIAEGVVLATFGVLLGAPLGVGYAWGVIAALRTWWAGMVGGTALWLHIEPGSVLVGALSGLLIGALSVAWGAWSLGNDAPLQLLAGWQAHGVRPVRRIVRRVIQGAAGGLLLLALVLLVLAFRQVVTPAVAAFIAGAALLIAGLCATAAVLIRVLFLRRAIPTPARLALRSAAANRGRSLLAVGLLASAAFMVVMVAANARDTGSMDLTARSAGTGGFALRATSSLPIRYDLGSPEGRKNLSFSKADEAIMAGATVYSCLESPGEDISCLNLAKPGYPRVLGLSAPFLARGGFTVTTVAGDMATPWRLLDTPAADGAIPVFGDADSVLWTLHSGLGQRYTMPDESGNPVQVRIVGLVRGSIFAGELLMAEANYRRLFPSSVTPRYFLIDAPAAQAAVVGDTLRRNLGDLGLQVTTTRELLDRYLTVQNTYLSTFLAIGGLGILLGTLGLLVVLLRNALERAREFALLLALGFTARDLAALLLLENTALLVVGLVCGAGAALLAILPQLASAGAAVHWLSVVGLLVGILLVGLLSSTLVARLIVSKDLMRALREE